MTRKALITGITGQDGSYLAEFLLNKGYEVYGIIRRSSTFNTSNLSNILKNSCLHLIFGDLSDASSINKIIREVQPDEIYNLGAQSHVGLSFGIPEYTSDINALGTLRILEAIKQEGLIKKIKFYQASTSELFGKVRETPQTEKTPFYPRSPYGCAKLFSFWITKNYKESYGMFISNGILFNHESPRRGETFVTKKITKAVACIKEGLQNCLYLGNLDSKRDWGSAKDYIEAMWLMLQKDKPEDYIIATGETHSVREFLEEAFKIAGIEIESNNQKGVDEEYIRKDNGKVVVKIDPKYYRPAEVDFLCGDSSKAQKELNWKPKIFFKELVKEMVEYDIKELSKELYGTKNSQEREV